MATMKDIARRANVSVATVSAVINQSRFVSKELEERVKQVIRDLDYRPNDLARALRQNLSRTIAYVLPSITNPFFPEMLKGLQERMFANGYSVIVCNTDGDPARLKSYGLLFLTNRVDGVVVSSPGSAQLQQIVQELGNANVPVTVLHGPRSLNKADRVLTDDEEGGYQGTRHLISLQHKRIAFLGVQASTTSRFREAGYQRAMSESTILTDSSLIHKGSDFSEQSGYQLASMALSQSKQRPTALVAANDPMALGAVEACRTLGLSIPNEVSIVAFDDTLAPLVRPKLTSVSFPKYAMGEQAAEFILHRLQKAAANGHCQTVMAPALVVRESTIRCEQLRRV